MVHLLIKAWRVLKYLVSWIKKFALENTNMGKMGFGKMHVWGI